MNDKREFCFRKKCAYKIPTHIMTSLSVFEKKKTIQYKGCKRKTLIFLKNQLLLRSLYFGDFSNNCIENRRKCSK